MKYKLGRKPYKPSPRDLKLSKYLKVELLPTIPPQYGDEGLIPANEWGMLGNNIVGNCVICAIWHMIILWNKAAGKTINVSAQTAINTYSAITGYDPNNPDSDQGTDERSALLYALNTGFTDDDGNIHKIGAFANIDITNQSYLDAAAYIFETILLGIQFPDSAMEQFNNVQVWDVVPDATIEGGHGICQVAKRTNRISTGIS